MDSFMPASYLENLPREELEAKIYRRRIYAVQRILKPKSMLLTGWYTTKDFIEKLFIKRRISVLVCICYRRSFNVS
jgi:hypothetical protein